MNKLLKLKLFIVVTPCTDFY